MKLICTCHKHPDCSGCSDKLAVRHNGIGFFIGNPDELDHICRPTDYFESRDSAEAALAFLSLK